MKKAVAFFIVLLILFGIMYLISRSKNTQIIETEKQISLSEVRLHNSKENCWIAIEGGVYDVTNFISKHPGGEIIVSACGTDATEKFNKRPILGTSHSSLARKMLQDLRLGSLTK